MQEIAAIAGVSVTTVSHVLSGKRPVNARTADRIRAVIDRHGYVPAAAARQLKSGDSGLIGFIVPDLSMSYFSGVAAGLEAAAATRGVGMILCSTRGAESGTPRFVDLLRNATLDGVVYVPGSPRTDALVPALAADFPIVLADEDLPGSEIPAVTSDNVAGGRLLGAHLTELGHRRVLVLRGPADLGSSPARAAGVSESFPQALTLQGDFTERSGYELTGQALANGVTFTCIAAANDDQALGAIRRLREEGIRVPQDCSVVGFDDIPTAEYAGLTTVRQDVVSVGKQAADLLLDRIASRSSAPLSGEKIFIGVELVVRDTTAPPPS